jgi:hypothetical protein
MDTETLEHAVLNQLQADFGDNDFDAYSEMIHALMKSKKNKEILFQYLSDTAQENLLKGETYKRY